MEAKRKKVKSKGRQRRKKNREKERKEDEEEKGDIRKGAKAHVNRRTDIRHVLNSLSNQSRGELPFVK